jgi:hypothetical protein
MLSPPPVPPRARSSSLLRLAWSGLRTCDLGDEERLLRMYRIVLLKGRCEGYTCHLDATQLIAHWPILRKMLGRGVRTIWEDRFAQYVVRE